MDKNKIKTMASAALAALAVFAFSAAAAPGTDADPLVSKSYIDSVVYPYIDSVAGSGKAGLKVVEPDVGQSVIAAAGAEIILRGGSATVIASQKGGLCDVTGGADLAGGSAVPANHLLLVPRGDGRGVVAGRGAVLVIRGGYELK